MRPQPLLRLCAALALGGALAPVQADRADRSQPIHIEADKPGSVDLQRQLVVFNGNVVVTQGTMRIRAERLELHDVGEGHRTATALGVAGHPANFRQKREGLDEFIDGVADRIEYDSRSELLRLVGNAQVRRLRGTTVADEITGNLITYNNQAEVFNVAGDNAPGSRVRAVLTPPPPSPAQAASDAPAGTPR